MGLTAANIITEAMKARGVIDPDETPSNAEMEHNRSRLNRLLDLWSVRRLTVYVLTEDTKTLTIGDGDYTIGQSGTPDITSVRPVKIDHAFLRDGSYDYQIDCTMTEAEYSAISDKTLSVLPTRLFYRNSVPNGTIRFNYLPDKAYSAHFFSVKPLTAFADLTTEYDFPPGYSAALTANLATMLDYKASPVENRHIAEARDTLDAIKSMNTDIPNMSLALVPGASGSGGRNIMEF